jgi:hypothetical protein
MENADTIKEHYEDDHVRVTRVESKKNQFFDYRIIEDKATGHRAMLFVIGLTSPVIWPLPPIPAAE